MTLYTHRPKVISDYRAKPGRPTCDPRFSGQIPMLDPPRKSKRKNQVKKTRGGKR